MFFTDRSLAMREMTFKVDAVAGLQSNGAVREFYFDFSSQHVEKFFACMLVVEEFFTLGRRVHDEGVTCSLRTRFAAIGIMFKRARPLGFAARARSTHMLSSSTASPKICATSTSNACASFKTVEIDGYADTALDF